MSDRPGDFQKEVARNAVGAPRDYPQDDSPSTEQNGRNAGAGKSPKTPDADDTPQGECPPIKAPFTSAGEHWCPCGWEGTIRELKPLDADDENLIANGGDFEPETRWCPECGEKRPCLCRWCKLDEILDGPLKDEYPHVKITNPPKLWTPGSPDLPKPPITRHDSLEVENAVRKRMEEEEE